MKPSQEWDCVTIQSIYVCGRGYMHFFTTSVVRSELYLCCFSSSLCLDVAPSCVSHTNRETEKTCSYSVDHGRDEEQRCMSIHSDSIRDNGKVYTSCFYKIMTIKFKICKCTGRETHLFIFVLYALYVNFIRKKGFV